MSFDKRGFEIQGQHIAWWLMALFFLGVTYVGFKAWDYVSMFFLPAFTAALFACYLSGWCTELTKKLNGRRTLASALIAVLLTFVIVIPATVSSFYGVSQLVNGVHVVMDENKRLELKDGAVEKMQTVVEEYPWSGVVVNKVIDVVKSFDTNQSILVGFMSFNGAVKSIGTKIVSFATSILSNGLNLSFQILVMVVALFVFLKNGEGYMQSMVKAFPFEKERTRRAFADISKGVNALFNSMVVTGIVQGGMGAMVIGLYSLVYYPINFLLFVFITFLMMLFSAIPVAGATAGVAVWVLIAVFQKHFIVAACMAVTAFVIGLSDNVIKPKIMSDAVEVSPLLLIIFMVGGVAADGAIGILSGPCLVILLIVIKREFGEKFGEFKEDLKTQLQAKENTKTSIHVVGEVVTGK